MEVATCGDQHMVACHPGGVSIKGHLGGQLSVANSYRPGARGDLVYAWAIYSQMQVALMGDLK